MTDNKSIKSEQWFVRELNSKINNGDISKPKYQRKRKWDTIHIKDNKANEQDYIKFLYDTQHSVHAITFGQLNNNNKISFSNIDGNNRINAIKHFIDTPFDIFPEHLNELFNLFDTMKKSVDSNIISQIKNIFSTISYNDVIKIKTPQRYFKKINQEELYSNVLSINLQIDEAVEQIQNNLKINGVLEFDTNVKITVNLFHGYNTDELCKIFEDINKFNSALTEIELLACRLFNETTFSINCPRFKSRLLNKLTEIYTSRSKEEALQCFIYDEASNTMNAYDFIISFQGILSDQYEFIEKNSTVLSLLFKIYKGIYTLHDSFTSENINEFIDKLTYSCEVLHKIINTIFTETINVNLFTGKCQAKLKTLKTNHIYMLISCIIGYYDQNIDIKIIINSIEKCLLYHFMVADIVNMDIREELQAFDTIGYKAGGQYIDNIVHKLLVHPSEISNKITRGQFSKLINHLYVENSTVYERFLDNEHTKHKNDKRRSLKFYEKSLMFYYYKQKIPTNMLDNKFSIEHICPNSSTWNGELNKDRPGNLIPIINSMNCSRNNKHISSYINVDNQGFCQYIKDIIPDNTCYDLIINHDKKPHIINNDKYNEMCSYNENIYLDNFLKCLYY